MAPDAVSALGATAMAFLGAVLTFVVALFLKLCFSTALFGTLAEVNRRIHVFRQNRRPTQRALLLVAAVIVFCSGVLLLLNLSHVISGGAFAEGGVSLPNLLQPMAILWAFLRAGFLLVAVVGGGAVGFLTGRSVALGRDRFGGILTANRGRYLGFWLFAFAVCGLIRLLPWGFVTYGAIWTLTLAACCVAAAHWTLYRACRTALAAHVPDLPEGDALDWSLATPEALALSALIRSPRRITSESLAKVLGTRDPAWMAHPAWAAQAQAMGQDAAACEAALEGLQGRGLAARDGRKWTLAGGAQRLAAMGFVEEAAGLTVRRAGLSRTVVLQRRGNTAILVEPGPETLTVRELTPGSECSVALLDAARGSLR